MLNIRTRIRTDLNLSKRIRSRIRSENIRTVFIPIQKEALPAPRQVTFEANPGKIQDMVDSAINRALINQAGVLSNTVFNAVARTFKEGQLPPNYVGPVCHQLGSPVVTAPSATLGLTNVQSMPMMTNPSTSDEQIKLATDLLASAISGSVPPNWWGYGMPLEMMLKTPDTSQTADMRGKAPMASVLIFGNAIRK